MYRTIFDIALWGTTVFLTLVAPGSRNWCNDNYYKLFPIYLLFLGIAITISIISRGDRLKNILGAIVSASLAILCFLMALFPRKMFWNLIFDFACPSGSKWGSKYDAVWGEPFSMGVIRFFDMESEAVHFLCLMMCYVVIFGIVFLRILPELKDCSEYSEE